MELKEDTEAFMDYHDTAPGGRIEVEGLGADSKVGCKLRGFLDCQLMSRLYVD
jgi:hypothetical protein